MNAHRSRVATLLLGLFLSVIAVATRVQGADDVTALDAQPPALRSHLAALAPANLATALAWQIDTRRWRSMRPTTRISFFCAAGRPSPITSSMLLMMAQPGSFRM
jgi:hypothetical protein